MATTHFHWSNLPRCECSQCAQRPEENSPTHYHIRWSSDPLVQLGYWNALCFSWIVLRKMQPDASVADIVFDGAWAIDNTEEYKTYTFHDHQYQIIKLVF